MFDCSNIIVAGDARDIKSALVITSKARQSIRSKVVVSFEMISKFVCPKIPAIDILVAFYNCIIVIQALATCMRRKRHPDNCCQRGGNKKTIQHKTPDRYKLDK